jgi:hypothetical protein
MAFWIDNTGGVSRVKCTDQESGGVIPMNLLIVAGVGGGKTLASEQLVNYYHRNKWVVISLSDVKDGVEFGFSMFDPVAPYQVRKLRKFGCPKEAIPTKVYHPFTFDLPKNIKEPDINIYTINIKNLTRIDMGFLSESAENKRSTQIILETIDKMNKSDGLHHMIFNAEAQTESIANLTKSSVKFRSDNADDFFTKTKIGTEKTASEMSAYFKPFIKDYTLAPADCKYNLNIRQVMNDLEHYHIFTTKWIKDRRLKAFYVLHLLQEIINNETYAKHPICIYLEEIRFLTPNSSDGFSSFLAEELKNTMTRFRNMGKGFAIISTTQVYRDVHPSVIDSFNEIVLGRISSFKEIEFIAKALKFTTQDVNLLKSLDVGEFIIKTKDQYSDEPELQKIKYYMPPHAHKEGGYSWFEFYHKYHPELMRTYNTEIEYMNETAQRIVDEVTVLKDKENIMKRDAVKMEREQKLDKEKLRMKIQMQKIQKTVEKTDKVDEKMKEMIYREWQSATGKSKGFNAIARKFNMIQPSGQPSANTIRRIIMEFERKNNPQIETNSDETVEGLDPKELYEDSQIKSKE